MCSLLQLWHHFVTCSCKTMFGCCLLLGQITILYMCITQVVTNACSYTTGSHSVCAVRTLLVVDCKALSIRRNPCWMVFLIQSSTQYSIPLVTPSNTYMLLLEATCPLLYVLNASCYLYFWFSCELFSTFPDTFFWWCSYSYLDNNNNNNMSSMHSPWNA